MREEGLEPNIKAWNALLDALGKAQQLELMLKQFEAMKAARVVADCSTYSTLTSAFAVAGRDSVVDKLYSEALECGAIDPYECNRMSGVGSRKHGIDAAGTIIDLHDLNVTMALAAVRRELQLVAAGKHAGPLQIVTGKGTNTGITPIRDAVIAMLQEREIVYEIPAHNAGVLVVP
jgi:pentatricopeptide repeat protein